MSNQHFHFSKYRILSLMGLMAFTASNSFAEELRDVKSPIDLPRSFILIIILAIAVMGALGFILYWKRFRNVNKHKQLVVISPWEKAYRELENLSNSDLLAKKAFKEFYTRMSEVIRQYLEERFQLRAPEMTTEEFLVSMKSTDHLNSEQKAVLKEFLEISDLVKFAKFLPDVSDTEKHFKIAKSFIDQTKPKQDIEPNASV